MMFPYLMKRPAWHGRFYTWQGHSGWYWQRNYSDTARGPFPTRDKAKEAAVRTQRVFEMLEGKR